MASLRARRSGSGRAARFLPVEPRGIIGGLTTERDDPRRMCGRFTQALKAGELVALYGPAASLPDTAWAERWNGAPTQAFLACRVDDAGRRVLSLLRWGLVPSWARDRAIGSRLINARSETVHEKPAFRSAFRRRRCLVPANGWFEWSRTPAGKVPYWISLAHGRPFSLAGLWEAWGEGETRMESFTVLTCPAGEALRPLHARQPGGPGGADGGHLPPTPARAPAGGGGTGGVRGLARGGDACCAVAGTARRAVRAPAGEHDGEQHAERRAGGLAPGGRVREW